MAAKLNRPARAPLQAPQCAAATGAEPAVQTCEDTLERQEKDKKHEKALQQAQSAPRAGRTGGSGARAERPSEGKRCIDVTRGKPPSPSATAGPKRPE
jgi:hypothetical protein